MIVVSGAAPQRAAPEKPNGEKTETDTSVTAPAKIVQISPASSSPTLTMAEARTVTLTGAERPLGSTSAV